MLNGEDEYIYQLRVERTDRSRRIYTEAQYKDVFIQTWVDLLQEHQHTKSLTMIKIGKLDCTQLMKSLKSIKSCYRLLKDLINRLKDASRQKGWDQQANKCFCQFTHPAQWDRQICRCPRIAILPLATSLSQSCGSSKQVIITHKWNQADGEKIWVKTAQQAFWMPQMWGYITLMERLWRCLRRWYGQTACWWFLES